MKKTFSLSFAVFAAVYLHAQLIVATGNIPSARLGHQSQLLANGNVLAFGGDNGHGLNPVSYTSAELYNPRCGTWTPTGGIYIARDLAASVMLSNGNVLVIGGE